MQSMRLLEFLYAITKSDTTEYEYDMDDPSDVKLYNLSQRNHTPIAELLADNLDHCTGSQDYNNDIALSPSDEMRIEEEADKESRMFFSQIDDDYENEKVIVLDSSSESDSEPSSTRDECILNIPCALDVSTGPERITTKNDTSTSVIINNTTISSTIVQTNLLKKIEMDQLNTSINESQRMYYHQYQCVVIHS